MDLNISKDFFETELKVLINVIKLFITNLFSVFGVYAGKQKYLGTRS